MAISKNKKLLYQLKKHVLERDNYTCRKCGLASIPESHREEYLTKLESKVHPVDVYDWQLNEPLTKTSQVTSDQGPDDYITWCNQCSHMENVEQFEVLNIECPIHHDNIDRHFDTGCNEKEYDTQIAIWLNNLDLTMLKEIAHRENKTCRDLLTEAMHNLFDKYDPSEEIEE